MTVLTGLVIILALAAAAALAVLGRIAALAEILPLQSTPLRSLAAKLSASVVSEPYAHPDRDEIPVPALRLLDAQKSSVDEEGGRIGERPLEPDTRIP